MKKKKIAYTALCAAAMAALTLLAAFQAGCGATCDRIEKDRKAFLARQGENKETHIEVLVPFSVAERLLEPYISAVKPIDVNIPGLGKVEKYLGALSVAPARVKLKAASADHIGFHLDFEIRANGKRAFEMFLETEVRPEINLKTGKITFGFTPEALERATPGMSKNAKNDLGDLIYSRIPSVAKILISRSMVQSAAGTVVDMMMSGFYEKTKNKLLPKLSKMSKFSVAIPDVPLGAVSVTSTEDNGGRVKLAIVTSLPVSAGISEPGPARPSRKSITIRMSGSTVAELVNWAMAKGLTPNRYNSKGKAKKDGELWPGLDWVAGEEHPMKVYLWDLTKPCMRITMAAKPTVKIVDESLEINAGDVKTDDVEASAFTKVGVWFHLLWRDALKLQKKASTRTKITVGKKKIDIVVNKASVEKDELKLIVDMAVKEE